MALRRRLSTPLNGYARVVKTSRGYEYLDASYGSRLSNFLSAPLTDLSLQEAVAAVEQDVVKDNRVAVARGDVNEVQQNGYTIELYFAPKSINEIKAQDNTAGSYAQDSVFNAQVATNYSLIIPLY
jgi:hypothetical protein